MPENSVRPFPEFYPRGPLILAHRGANRHALENTLTAFEVAHSLGADGIELDVQLSADGALVVFHDTRLGRLTPSNRRVSSLSLTSLQARELGTHLDPGFTGQIPTLDNVFDLFATRLLFNVELKSVGRQREELVKKVTSCIRRHQQEERVVVSSFDARTLHILRRHAPDIQTGQLANKAHGLRLPLPQWIYSRNLGDVHAIHPNYRFVNQEVGRKAHQLGLRVNVWTVNAPDDIRKMLDYGVDMIITDVPDVARGIVDARILET